MTSTAATPVVLDPAAALPDPTRVLRRRLRVVLGVAAPVLLWAGSLTAPVLHGSNAAVMAALPPVAGRLLTAHLLNATAGLLFIALAAVVLRIPVAAGAVLRFAGSVLLVVGFVSDALGEVVDGYTAWAGVQAGVPSADLGRLFDVLDESAAALPVSWLAIPVAELGGVLLLVGVLRAHRVVPVWAPVVALAGLVLDGLFPSGPLAASGVVGVVGLAAVTLLADRSGRA